MNLEGLVSVMKPLSDLRNFVDQHSDIIYQKTDSEHSACYELLMSYTHDVTTSKVVGFYKGARNPSTASYLDHVRKSAHEIIHPMLVPMLVLSSRIGPRQEKHQREARKNLRVVEVALDAHMRSSGHEPMNLDKINANLVACHSRVWKHPAASHIVIDRMGDILSDISRFWQGPENQQDLVQQINSRYIDRVIFIRDQLRGIESHCHTTLLMMDMARTALHNILLDRQNKTALRIEKARIEEDERKFSVNQNWNKNQRTLSLLGILFLPGAFISVSVSVLLRIAEGNDPANKIGATVNLQYDVL
jgi:hypothetical protein